jgi:hypothetical protein
MTITGYSDRINHALAFAAKHHDRQVQRGTRSLYRTHAANVAIILTRYERDDDTVVAGILQEVVADYVQDRHTRAMLDQRLGDKFGAAPLDATLAIVPRLHDDEGIELSLEERRADLLVRLETAGTSAQWVCAAQALHDASSTLADVRRTIDPESVWSRLPLGRDGTVNWFQRLHGRLKQVGFDGPIMSELAAAIDELRGQP